MGRFFFALNFYKELFLKLFTFFMVPFYKEQKGYRLNKDDTCLLIFRKNKYFF